MPQGLPSNLSLDIGVGFEVRYGVENARNSNEPETE